MKPWPLLASSCALAFLWYGRECALRTPAPAKPPAITNGKSVASTTAASTGLGRVSVAVSRSLATKMVGLMADPQPPSFEPDERWLGEYIEFGWTGPKGLLRWMKNHADFDDYYAKREPKQEDENESAS